jgi:hydrogenase expression/formation protein HypC
MCLGIPGQIVEIVDTENRVAKVDVSGVRRNVDVGLLWDGPDAAGVGDWVLIHVGFAISRIDEGEARETLRALRALGQTYEEELADLKTSAID